MKSIELQKGIVIALMLSSVLVQSLNYAALARGGGGRSGGWAMSRAAFMRPSFNHSDYGRSDFGRMKSVEAPRAFNRNEFGGVRSAAGTKDFGQHQISAAADRSAHVQDYNWGKSPEGAAKSECVKNFGQSNLLAKAPVAKSVPANSKTPFGKDHPRRNEVWDRDKILGNKIQDDKGDLSGHYAQLKREDSLIKKQEQIDARLHDGHITSAEQRRLNHEEYKLARQIKQDVRGKFPHSLPNQPGPKANMPRTNAPGFGKTGMSLTGVPTTGSATPNKNGLTPVSTLPSTTNLPQLSNVPVSSAGTTTGTSATESTSNAAPVMQSAGGLDSSLPMMSPQMFGGSDDSQSDDPYNEGDNTDDSNNSTNPANSATR